MKKIALTITSIFLLSIVMIHAQNKTFSESYSGIKKVSVDIQNGDLKITKSISGELEVNGNYDAGRLKIKAEQIGQKLMIKEDNNRLKSNTESKWTIAVPEGTDLIFNIGAGEVTLEGVKGEVNGNTGAGNLLLKKADCNLTFNTGAGSVDVADSSGDMKINSGTGNISFNKTTGVVTANTGTGDILFDHSVGKLDANTGTGNIKAEQVSILQASSFNTGTGKVEISLGGEVQADISLNSGTNTSSLDMNGQKFNGTLTMSCNKKDGDIVSPFGFDEEKVEGDGNNATVYKTKRFGDADVEIKIGVGKGKAVVEK